jgi:hypothetical protein
MTKGLKYYFNSIFCYCTSIGLILGCSITTKPNTSVIDRDYGINKKKENDVNFRELKELLFVIALDNETLAFELGKLPEFQDTVTNQEVHALKELLRILNNYPQQFNLAFSQMNQIGLPLVRRFNASLQALFWLFLDGYIDEAKAIVLDYTLKDLLRAAWLLRHTRHLNRWKWRTEEAKKLYNSCVDEDLRKNIVEFYKKNKGATDFIILLSERYPDLFTYKFKPFENELRKQKNRWDDFEDVVGRINSPELIHYYIMSEYSYGAETYRDPKLIFKYKSGTPDSIARFGEFLLKKAGYKTFIKRVTVHGSMCAKEHTGSGIVLSDGSFLLVIDFPKGKSITGPYDGATLDQVLSQGHCLYPHEWFYHIPDDKLLNGDPFADTI